MAGDDRQQARERNERDPRPVIGAVFERTVGLAAQLAQSVDAKGVYYPSHSQGVEQLARSIAEHMGLNPQRVARVALAGLLHDVGKLLTPDRVLLKPATLDKDERQIMEMHPVDGERILIAAGFGDEALWVRHHHSHWNGSGYPDTLGGEEIPLEARIVGAADALHAMQSDRPYSRAHSVRWALAEMDASAGSQFDPEVVAAVHDMELTR